MDSTDSLRAQTPLLQAEELDVSGLVAQGIVPADESPPAIEPELDLAAERIRLIADAGYLGAPDEIFRYADIQEIIGQPMGNWSQTNEFLKNWWTRRLAVDGHPLIIPRKRKR